MLQVPVRITRFRWRRTCSIGALEFAADEFVGIARWRRTVARWCVKLSFLPCFPIGRPEPESHRRLDRKALIVNRVGLGSLIECWRNFLSCVTIAVLPPAKVREDVVIHCTFTVALAA